MTPELPPRFTVLDTLGLAKLEKRRGDLDGSVPLRVAQACLPLLEGNAFGFQVVVRSGAVDVRRRLGRVTAELAEPQRESLLAGHRATLARLVAQGFLHDGGAWHRLLERGPVTVERGRVRVFTGLLAKPDEGLWLRLSGAANRRNVLVELEPVWLPDASAFVPLVLDLTLRKDAPDRARLEGELATLAPFQPGATFDEQPLHAALDVARAHADFYDPAYFAAKKHEPTRKYRRMLGSRSKAPVATDKAARCQLVVAGPRCHLAVPHTARRFATEEGMTSERPAQGLASVTFVNVVPFEARFDGHTVAIEPDRAALAKGARAVEEAWERALGAAYLDAHRGALLYLTKYFTPHTAGEAHFFVKPAAFTRTPAGWSSLLEGAHGEGWDVMRGVVATDSFFATPAVFKVHRVGDAIRVGAGEPLLEVIPVPRGLALAGYRSAKFHDA